MEVADGCEGCDGDDEGEGEGGVLDGGDEDEGGVLDGGDEDEGDGDGEDEGGVLDGDEDEDCWGDSQATSTSAVAQHVNNWLIRLIAFLWMTSGLSPTEAEV